MDDQLVKSQGVVTSAPSLQQALVPGQPTPTSPLMAAMTGASPDASKMVGTPNQQANAVRQSVESRETLRAALDQAKPVKTAGERNAQEVQDLGKFARADEAFAKVAQENLMKSLGTKASALPNATLGIKDDVVSARLNQASPTYQQDLAQTKQSLAALVNPAVTDAEKQVALQNLSRTLGDPSKPFTGYEQLAQYFTSPTPTELLQNLNADSSLALKTTVAQLSNDDWRSIGFTDSRQAASALGVPPEAFSAMTWEQVKERVEKVRLDKYSNSERLTAAANNTLLPPQVRNDARAQLRAMGLVGKRTDEEKVNNLQAQMQDNDRVQLPTGESVSITELLQPGPMMGVITAAASDPAVLAKLKADPKSKPLADWVEKNARGLLGLADVLRPQLQAAQATYDANKQKLGDAPSELVNLLLPDFAKAPAASGAIQSAPAYFDVRKQLAPTDQAALDNVMMELSRRDPAQAKALANKTLPELQAMEIFGLPTSQSGPVRQLQQKQDAATLSSLPLTSDAALSAGSSLAFNGQGNVIANLAKDSPETLAGIFAQLPADARRLLDGDNDGKPDDLATLIRRAGQTPELLQEMRKLPELLLNARAANDTIVADKQKAVDAAAREAEKQQLLAAQAEQQRKLEQMAAEQKKQLEDFQRQQAAAAEEARKAQEAAIAKEQKYNGDLQHFDRVLARLNGGDLTADWLQYNLDAVKADPRLKPQFDQIVAKSDAILQKQAANGDADPAVLQRYVDAGLVPAHYAVSNIHVKNAKASDAMRRSMNGQMDVLARDFQPGGKYSGSPGAGAVLAAMNQLRASTNVAPIFLDMNAVMQASAAVNAALKQAPGVPGSALSSMFPIRWNGVDLVNGQAKNVTYGIPL